MVIWEETFLLRLPHSVSAPDHILLSQMLLGRQKCFTIKKRKAVEDETCIKLK